MSRDPDEVVDFRTGADQDVVARMRALAATRDGWVNLYPVVEEEDLPVRRGLDGLLAGRLPLLPIATWIPGEVKRGTAGPTSVGIQHPVQAKVATRLVEAGLRPPDGWHGKQDHPRRGLIVEVPDGTDPAVVLDWVLRVIEELSPVELAGDWRAAVFHR